MSYAAVPPGPVTMDLPFVSESAGEARRALVAWLQDHGTAQPVVDDARLVMTELVSNAVRHAAPLGGTDLRVCWSRSGDALSLSVYDGGAPNTPRQVAAPADSESGRGLAIVDALSQEWRVERLAEATVIHVLLRMDAPDDSRITGIA
ncbi:MAG: ATP-binding protein [Propionibacteriales bacterium]|nr:ATP-binding protein [Propionibacteriales bacterium]